MRDTPDTHAQLVAAGYLRRGQDVATVARATGLIANVDPSTLVNIIGVGCDAGETTLSMMHNDGAGTATKVALGANFPANTQSVDVYELVLYCDPNGSVVGYRVTRLNTGHTTSKPQASDLTCAPVAGVTVAVEGVLLVRSADHAVAGPAVGIAWPYGCTDGVGEIVIGDASAAGNISAPFAVETATLPDAGSWPVSVRATFTAGGSPSGGFGITLASSDGATEVSIGAGSWLRVWVLG